jgi:hypothetical protein
MESLQIYPPLHRWKLCPISSVLPSFLFLWPCVFPLRAAAVAVLVAMLTDAFFMLQLVLHLCHRLTLFQPHACRAGFSAFPVVVSAGSVSGFAGRRHHPVAAKMPWKMVLLVEVPAGLAGATAVMAAVVVSVAAVALVVVALEAAVDLAVVLVEAVDVAAVVAAAVEPWQCIPLSRHHPRLRPVRLPCFLSVGVKLLVLLACDTGKAYPPALSVAELWIPFRGPLQCNSIYR